MILDGEIDVFDQRLISRFDAGSSKERDLSRRNRLTSSAAVDQPVAARKARRRDQGLRAAPIASFCPPYEELSSTGKFGSALHSAQDPS